MENRSPYFVARLIALLVFSFSAAAGASEPSSAQQAEWQQRLERAAELKAEGKAYLAAADQVFEDRTLACAEKLLVNGCRNEARQVHIAAAKEARAIENRGKALELAVKKEQALDRDQRLAADLQQRDADLKARATDVRDDRQAASELRAKTLANKARRAEEGMSRKAAEAERLRQKQAAHDARLADHMKGAERRAAKAVTESN